MVARWCCQRLAAPGVESIVYEFQPEEILSYGWESIYWTGGVVNWQLERVDAQTRLLFNHAEEDLMNPDHYARMLANWHITLDLFESSLAGSPQPWGWDAWAAHCARYMRTIKSMIDSSG